MVQTMDREIREAIDTCVKTDHYGLHADPRIEALAKVVEALRSQKIELLDLVLHLDSALNDTSNPQGRRQACQLLADCLKDPSAHLKLNFKHVETFVEFFTSKLVDWQCVEGAVTGLSALMLRHGPQLRTLKDGKGHPLCTHMARTLFKAVHTPSHTQQVRKAVLDLVRTLLDDWRDEVSILGAELGEGVYGVIEEERDPRNLLAAFSISKTLFECLPAECVSEDTLSSLFESLSAYFPITFTPPKDDKFGITGEDLKAGLCGAIGATERLAPLSVPFLLDTSKDITSGESEDTIRDALVMLSFCLEKYGAKTTRSYIGDILITARDQLCRTTTPCPDEFAAAVRLALKVALGDAPVGLMPAWLSKQVEPAIKMWVYSAGLSGGSLASAGAKRLLVAAASAHACLLQHVWAQVVPALLAVDKASGAFPNESLPFVLDLVRAAEAPSGKSLLAARQLKQALGGALAALLSMEPGDEHKVDESGGLDGDILLGRRALAVAVRLVGLLCRLAGEEPSAEAFSVLCALLLQPATPTDGTRDAWSARWREALAQAEDDTTSALLKAVTDIMGVQPAPAAAAAPGLLAGADSQPAWLAAARPRLLMTSALCLARAAAEPAVQEPAGETDAAADAGGAHARTARELLTCVVKVAMVGFTPDADVLRAVADALEAAPAGAGAGWAASRLVEALGLPAGLDELCCAACAEQGAGPVRRLLSALLARLPREEAQALRSSVLLAAGAAADGDVSRADVLALVPPALAEAPQDWQGAEQLLRTACRCASEPRLARAAPLALEALEAVVVASAEDQIGPLMRSFRDAFEPVLRADAAGDAAGDAARGAARCWAAAAGALLKRGSSGSAAAAEVLLEVLLASLRTPGAPVTPFIPEAFRVMMPPAFERGAAAAQPKLPPLVLQRLSHTVLGPLVSAAKAAAAAAPPTGLPAGSPGLAALEAAVAVLSALPVEVASADCKDDLRWCTLTGLKVLQGDAASHVFSAQVLQLLVRAGLRQMAWLEDDLSAIVPALLAACLAHLVPLVRIGCLQALQLLIEQSQGHLLPYKKAIESTTRRAVEDRRREVRLVAASCLNAWHCGLTAEAS